MKKIISIFAFLAIAILQTNCSNDDHKTATNEPDKTGSEWKGLGKSKEKPEGTPFSLPSGIKLASTINGYSEFDCGCQRRDEPCFRGTGENVRVCLGFTNTTSGPITVTIPQGLILISNDVKVQNGLIIELETFEIPAEQTMYYSLGAYCLNVGRHIPKEVTTFELGPVTENASLKELMEFVETKIISDPSDAGMVQGAIWGITEDDGFENYFRQIIAAFPDK